MTPFSDHCEFSPPSLPVCLVSTYCMWVGTSFGCGNKWLGREVLVAFFLFQPLCQCQARSKRVEPLSPSCQKHTGTHKNPQSGAIGLLQHFPPNSDLL